MVSIRLLESTILYGIFQKWLNITSYFYQHQVYVSASLLIGRPGLFFLSYLEIAIHSCSFSFICYSSFVTERSKTCEHRDTAWYYSHAQIINTCFRISGMFKCIKFSCFEKYKCWMLTLVFVKYNLHKWTAL